MSTYNNHTTLATTAFDTADSSCLTHASMYAYGSTIPYCKPRDLGGSAKADDDDRWAESFDEPVRRVYEGINEFSWRNELEYALASNHLEMADNRGLRARDSSDIGEAKSKQPVRNRRGEFVNWMNEYKKKHDFLTEYYEEVDAETFYKAIFPPESIGEYISIEDKKKGLPVPEKRPNPIISYEIKYISKSGEERYGQRMSILWNDFKCLEKCINSHFALCNMIAYYGKERRKEHGYDCRGFAFDLDGVGIDELRLLCMGFDEGIIPIPTYLVSSGHGMHLYYVFEKPVPLNTAKNIQSLNELKKRLTDVIWTRETSMYNKRQYQNIYQSYRMVGSWTKLAKGRTKRTKFIVEAFETGKKVDLTYLSRFVDDFELDIDLVADRLTLEEAKEMYPKWYQNRIVEKQPPKPSGKITQARGLYDWWKQLLFKSEVAYDGNRYYSLCVLFAMGFKCNIPFEEVKADAYSLKDMFESRTINPDNHFTDKDIEKAMEFYNHQSAKLSNKGIEEMMGISLKPYIKTRRNGRTQKEHLERARILRVNLGSYENVGRPSKEALVREWQATHPGGTKLECRKELGISRPTINKYW